MGGEVNFGALTTAMAFTFAIHAAAGAVVEGK
jgi:hypothetical protein